jgi:hypothetical protein
MIGTVALVDAGQLQLFQRVGDPAQVLLGQVQISGCDLQTLMPEQKLEGAQVGAGLKQVGRQECRTRCGETALRMPAFFAACVHASHTTLSVIGCWQSRCRREGKR